MTCISKTVFLEGALAAGFYVRLVAFAARRLVAPNNGTVSRQGSGYTNHVLELRIEYCNGDPGQFVKLLDDTLKFIYFIYKMQLFYSLPSVRAV